MKRDHMIHPLLPINLSFEIGIQKKGPMAMPLIEAQSWTRSAVRNMCETWRFSQCRISLSTTCCTIQLEVQTLKNSQALTALKQDKQEK